MRIFMLGWEFPPFIAGGLGTACFGLTRALDRAGHEVHFVLPKAVGDAQAKHVKLLGPEALRASITRVHEAAREEAQVAPGADTPEVVPAPGTAQADGASDLPEVLAPFADDLKRTKFFEVESEITTPYPGMQGSARFRQLIEAVAKHEGLKRADQLAGMGGLSGLTSSSARVLAKVMEEILESIEIDESEGGAYDGNLYDEAQRYARLVAGLGVQHQFDVIHAHDWLTYQAGMALRELTGKPLVCHVHATEFDRSGENVNQMVYDIERAGTHAADRVVTVSQLTRGILEKRYGVDPAKIAVVYNGVEQDEVPPEAGARIDKNDKIVLFLGRITLQKGPEYFIEAAKRVLEKVDNVKFVVAGSGDLAMKMIEQAADLGIGHKVLFTGFLRGRDVERVFKMADCYVMPSVSEPFGIAPLEAMQNDTPVIISKQSGVSEVLTHALKVDFWDTEEMANMIVAVMRYPPLRQTLREHGSFELRTLTWERSAKNVVQSYGRAIADRM